MDKKELLSKCEVITPVEEIHGDPVFKYVKRDDHFRPFQDLPLSGGKVRQAILLVNNNIDLIKNELDNNIWTATSMSSPQGVIVSRVASEYGVNSKLFIGSGCSKESISKNNLMMNSYGCGSSINYDARQAFETVLQAQIKKVAEETGEKFFNVKFGINLDTSPEALVASTAMQVQNIPDQLDNLVVPSGSCIILSGVVLGCLMFNKSVRNIIGVQISGYDRSSTVNHILETFGLTDPELLYTMKVSKDYPYSRHLNKYTIGVENIRLDPLYESKGYDYCLKHMPEIHGQNNLFWIVGDSTDIRNLKPKEEDVERFLYENRDHKKLYGGVDR